MLARTGEGALVARVRHNPRDGEPVDPGMSARQLVARREHQPRNDAADGRHQGRDQWIHVPGSHGARFLRDMERAVRRLRLSLLQLRAEHPGNRAREGGLHRLRTQ